LPWKFKLGVSGCINDCAETCVKDIGLVGTAKGWHVMVGGNGGGQPRLAKRLFEHVPSEAEALLTLCRDELKLDVMGLMCIPPADQEPAPHFAMLAQMARDFGLEALSMGMSGDFETAIRLGATHVRVGTAIFGERLTG